MLRMHGYVYSVQLVVAYWRKDGLALLYPEKQK